MIERRLGLTLPVPGLPIADTTVPLARLAEELGFTDIWSAEVDGTDGLSTLAAIAVTTETLRLGTAILPVFSRPPALYAMSAANLQALSRGRFVLGLGTSTSIVIGRWMGIPFEKPLTRTRETVAILREALAGKKVSFEGETVTAQGFRLTADPGAAVPIYIAALGPKMLRLAGEIADGVILYLFTPNGVRDAVAQVHEGARAAGREPEQIDVVIRIPVAVDEDEEFLLFMMRRMTAAYAMVDVYNASVTRQGFGEEARLLSELWRAGDRDGAAQAVTEEMLEQFYIFGDRDRCVTKIQAFREAGVKTPVIMPVSVAGDPADRMERTRRTIAALAGA